MNPYQQQSDAADEVLGRMKQRPMLAKARRAGRRWANDCVKAFFPFTRPTGPLPIGIDALSHLNLLGDTDDPDVRREEMRVANEAAKARWAEIVSAA